MRNSGFYLFIVLLLTMAALSSMAAEHGNIAINGEVRTYNKSQQLLFVSYNQSTDEPPARIGFRLLSGASHGFDLNFGMNLESAVSRDTTAATDNYPGQKTYSFEAGIFFKVARADKGYLAVLARGGIDLNQWWESDWHIHGSGGYSKYATYRVTIINFYLGLEPTYLLSRHIAIYTTIGLKIRLIPNSKYIDKNSSDYNWSTGSLPLKERNDARTIIATDGFWLGLRYYF